MEDDRSVGRSLERLLTEQGYVVDLVHEGEEARAMAFVHDYDGIVLDLELPDRMGLTILREFRREGDGTPVLILTGMNHEEAVVRGLDAGADDYVRKPVSDAEFRARVRVLVRRGRGTGLGERLSFGDLTLDRITHETHIGTDELDLTPTEFAILEHFLAQPGEVVPRTELLEKVWDMNFDPASNVVDVHLSRLRGKLRKAGADVVLETVRGAGVRLVGGGGEDR
ncbi:MAG: response regulator transcription factor [Gemmatimonadota bacterium]|nr:response regulator transcription factor [Gemmatimonadota bacterium]